MVTTIFIVSWDVYICLHSITYQQTGIIKLPQKRSSLNETHQNFFAAVAVVFIVVAVVVVVVCVCVCVCVCVHNFFQGHLKILDARRVT